MTGKILRGMVCVFGIFLCFSGIAKERLDWFMTLNPALIIRSERGKSQKLNWDCRDGLIRAYIEEKPDWNALIVWVELSKELNPAEMGNTELIPMGIELDLPEEYPRVLSFANDAFAPPRDTLVPSQGPVMFYNDKFETVIVSPADHFMVSMITQKGKDRFQIGLEGDLKSIPAGFKHPIIFYFGKGIRNSFVNWGDILLQWYGQKRDDLYADVGLSYLGYWTDNGAYYYYNTEKGMNYEETLLAVKADADRLGVPFKYFQVDSWWYFKSGPKRTGIGTLDWVKNLMGGGAIKWEAMPDLFPNGLEGFQKKLGLPLIAHNRWYDKDTEYKKEFKFVDGVGQRNPAFPVEDRFWDMIMDQAVKYGVKVYEQDWLATQWNMIPYLRENLDAGERWLTAMSKSAEKRGLTIQYCMANPGIFMQAVKYPNITQVRPSDDYLAGAPKQLYWIPFTKTSMLAWAVGLYPWKDVYLSSSGQRVIRDEKRPEEETLISILSAAMVGPGDKIGFINKPLLMRTCRADGLLLKPDIPAMPIDRMFVENNTLYTIITESATSIGTYYYVAGFNIYPQKYTQREITLQELGVKPGNYLIYNWARQELEREKDKIVFPRILDIYRSAYYVLVPEQSQTPSLIGEKEKFVTVSKARFKRIEQNGCRLNLKLSGVNGEELELAFRSEVKPLAKIISGAELLNSNFDADKRIFVLKLKLNSEIAELEVGK